MVKIRVLELFSGTHSIGKECKKRGYEVYSLDKILPNYDKLDKNKKYKSFKHFQEDIMNWNYKQYPIGYFDLITASPVCLFWSRLRYTWIGRKIRNKETGKLNEKPFTREDIENDINKYGKPMVDKIFEIINYYNPQYWWVENPKSSSMKKYITDKPFYDVDYCQYCLWGYKKPTRFWTNIKGFIPKKCNKKCPNIIINGKKQRIHKDRMGTSKTIKLNDGKLIRVNTKALREKYNDFENIQPQNRTKKQTYIGAGSNKLERYRIPPLLINSLLDSMHIKTHEILTNNTCINPINFCFKSSNYEIENIHC